MYFMMKDFLSSPPDLPFQGRRKLPLPFDSFCKYKAELRTYKIKLSMHKVELCTYKVQLSKYKVQLYDAIYDVTNTQ